MRVHSDLSESDQRCRKQRMKRHTASPEKWASFLCELGGKERLKNIFLLLYRGSALLSRLKERVFFLLCPVLLCYGFGFGLRKEDWLQTPQKPEVFQSRLSALRRVVRSLWLVYDREIAERIRLQRSIAVPVKIEVRQYSVTGHKAIV